ncbi:MAG: carboxypeptidase-like regulatory domain-containing protein [Chloroflexota bacterium]
MPSGAPSSSPSASPIAVSPAAATATIHGFAHDSGGNQMDGIQVIVAGTVQANTFWKYTNLGNFSFDVPADTYTVQVINGTYTANGYWCGGQHLCADKASASLIVAAPGGSYNTDLVIDQVSSITGTILNHDGTPDLQAKYGFDVTYLYNGVTYDGSFNQLIQPGTHKLAIKAGGDPQGYGPIGYYAVGQPGNWTQLEADATPINVPYASGPITLLPITLPATLTLSGTVTTVGGAPVSNGVVHVYQADVQVSWIALGADGSWSTQVPDPSAYTILADTSCPNLGAWYKATAPGYALDQASASTVSISGHDKTGVTLKVPTCPTISGTIRNHAGSPLSGAVVQLTGVDGTWTGSPSTVTGSDGAYSISVPLGHYEVQVWDQAGANVGGYYQSGASGNWAPNDTTATHLNVTISGAAGIDVQLPPFRYITGTVTTPDGQPAPGVGVGPSWLAWPTTGADGTYSLKVPPGSYTVSFGSTYKTKAGYYGASGYVANQADAAPVSTVAGNVGGIDVVVPFWPKITGTVLDASGNAIAGAAVVMGPTASWYQATSTTSAADGTYAFYTAWTGAWTIKASKAKYFAEGTRDVTLSGAADVAAADISLHAFPAVEGVVTASDGAPVANVSVEAYPYPYQPYWANLISYAVTDADGHYHLAVPMGTGAIAVRFIDGSQVHSGGFLGQGGFSLLEPKSVTVGTDEVAEGSVVLPTYHTLHGTLLGPDGSPVAYAQISAFADGAAQNTIATLYTGQDGTFSLKLPVGAWFISIASPTGYASGWLGSEGFNYSVSPAGRLAMPDHDLTRTVHLPPSFKVSGRVTYGSGGAGGIEVDLLQNGAAYGYAVTEPDGTWSIEAAPGAYIVGVYDPHEKFTHGWIGVSGFVLSSTAAKVVLVGASSVSGVNVALQTNKTISGLVRDTKLAARGYVYVEAWVNGNYYIHGWTNSAGKYSLHVPSGSVKLWIYDAYLKVAPGWRTSTSLTASYALGATTKVGSSSVAGVVITAPAPRFIYGTVTGKDPMEITHKIAGAYVSANAYGAMASLAYANSSGAFKMPVLPGTYTVWSDTIGLIAGEAAPWAGGWYKAGGITPNPAGALKVTPPSAGTKLAIRLEDPYQSAAPSPDPTAPASRRASWSPLAARELVQRHRPRRHLYRRRERHHAWLGERPAPARHAASTGGRERRPLRGGALVSWTNPNTAYRPIIHATVTASPGGNQCTAAGTTSCTVLRPDRRRGLRSRRR